MVVLGEVRFCGMLLGARFVARMLRVYSHAALQVGGVEEYDIIKAIESKVLTKPIVAWCIGTCAKVFPYEVQFGHAGACAHGKSETADAKNLALKLAGLSVSVYLFFWL